MKVMLINAVPYGSTGKIMFSISKLVKERGGNVVAATGFSWHKAKLENYEIIGNIFTKTLHMGLSRIFGNHGCYSTFSTNALIRKIKKFSPDIIHLHNVHGWYLNLSLLFKYLKECNIPVVWTLHDCWAFTGGCAHYAYCNCNRWLTGCGECCNLSSPPQRLLTASRSRRRLKLTAVIRSRPAAAASSVTSGSVSSPSTSRTI